MLTENSVQSTTFITTLSIVCLLLYFWIYRERFFKSNKELFFLLPFIIVLYQAYAATEYLSFFLELFDSLDNLFSVNEPISKLAEEAINTETQTIINNYNLNIPIALASLSIPITLLIKKYFK